MSILSTNHRLISIGESYSAGNGIDITDQIISVTGNVVPYSAGDNIDIQDHVISGKDWTQDITDASSNAFNETTAWVHDNYANSADVSYLSGVVENKLDTSAWSSVSSNLATEDYVIMADNITYDRTTGYVENQQFAKESACQSAFEQLNTNKLDASSFTDWQNGQYSTDLQTIEGQIANKLDTSSFSEVSGDFQPRGDYVERDTVYSAIESATSSKLDVSSFASVSSDFLTTSFGISESATWNETSDVVQSNSAQWAEGGSGDEEVNSFVYNNSATINEVNSAYQQYSASYQPSGNYIPYTASNIQPNTYDTNSALTLESNKNILYLKPALVEVTTGPMSVMKRTSIASGGITAQNRTTDDTTFISPNRIVLRDGTANRNALVDCSSVDNWNEVSTTVQTNSAQWAEGGGSNPEVESYVINNSATIDEVNTTYQSNSANYLTAHQSLANYYTTAEANTMSSMLSGAIDYVSANAGGNIPVSNSGDLYKVEFDGVDLYGYKRTTTIPNYVYTAMKSSTGNHIEAYDFPNFDNVGFSREIIFFNNADIITFSSNGDGIYPSEDARYGTTALNVYYKASNLYDWHRNQLSDFSGYIGKITLDNLVISSYINKPSYFNNIFRCGNVDLWFSSNYGRDNFSNEYVLTLVDEEQTGTNTFEGIFVPSSTDLSNYYTKSETSGASEIADALANLPTGNPEVEAYVQTNSAAIDETVTSYEQNSASYVVENNFEYDGNDLITAYNGSAFAGQGGGGEVPTGTMNVSGLEYNAVNEISGYNGSAIAQYGAEKQWLVHDDTLVHAANSAQYALGVNLSAVAQLLGIDETVLWSGSSQISTGSYIELNETPFNFDRVRIEYAHQVGWGGKHSETIPEFGKSANGKFVIGENWFRAAAGYNNMWHNLSYETFDSATNRIYHNSGFQGIVNNTAWNTNGDLPINYYKIVGIGRKS